MELTYQALNGNKEVAGSINNLKIFTRLAKLLKRNSSRLQEAYRLCDSITTQLDTHGILYPNIYAEMGDILVKMGNYPLAKSAIDTALQQDPKSVVAVTALARLEAQQGNVTTAEAVLRTALERIGRQLPLVLEMASHLLHHHHNNTQRMKEAKQL